MSPAAEQLVLWLIPGAPLAAAIVIALLGPKMLRQRSHWPCWLALAISTVCALVLLVDITPRAIEDEELAGVVATAGYTWLDIGRLNADIDLRADAMSTLMLSMVTS